MTHSYRAHCFHLIWSTKKRRPLITPNIQARLYPYLGSIILNHGGHLLEIGGMPDHVHLLIELSNLDKFSSLLRDLKASSSGWIHKNFSDLSDFAWQEGYASFAVSYSLLDQVKAYIQNQARHHQKMTFDDEYKKFLNVHKIKFDDRFVLG